MLLQDETQRWDKHVVPGMECLRTAVQFRPPPPFSEKAGPERVRLFRLVERTWKAKTASAKIGATYSAISSRSWTGRKCSSVCGRWYVSRTDEDGYDVDELGVRVAPRQDREKARVPNSPENVRWLAERQASWLRAEGRQAAAG